MDPLASIKITFFQECEEQLAELETGLLAMKDGDTDSETVNAVFRAVHSIKGGAGAFTLTDLVRFAHVFETVLDEMRAGRLTPDDILVLTDTAPAELPFVAGILTLQPSTPNAHSAILARSYGVPFAYPSTNGTTPLNVLALLA